MACRGKTEVLCFFCDCGNALAEAAHGIGGTFSAAFTAALAMKLAWKDALREAKACVLGSLREAVELSDQVQAMYPPTEDCIDFVKISKVLNK